jgi:hypothetical protein
MYAGVTSRLGPPGSPAVMWAAAAYRRMALGAACSTARGDSADIGPI